MARKNKTDNATTGVSPQKKKGRGGSQQWRQVQQKKKAGKTNDEKEKTDEDSEIPKVNRMTNRFAAFAAGSNNTDIQGKVDKVQFHIGTRGDTPPRSNRREDTKRAARIKSLENSVLKKRQQRNDRYREGVEETKEELPEFDDYDATKVAENTDTAAEFNSKEMEAYQQGNKVTPEKSDETKQDGEEDDDDNDDDDEEDEQEEESTDSMDDEVIVTGVKPGNKIGRRHVAVDSEDSDDDDEKVLESDDDEASEEEDDDDEIPPPPFNPKPRKKAPEDDGTGDEEMEEARKQKVGKGLGTFHKFAKAASSPAAKVQAKKTKPSEINYQEIDSLDLPPTDFTPPTTIRRKFYRRVDIKVSTKPSSTADVELRNALVQFLAKVKESDVHLIVIPYRKADSNLPTLRVMGDIPLAVGRLKKYFPGAIPRLAGGSHYMNVLIGTNKPLKEIKEDVDWWLGANGAGMWLSKVQAEKVERVGSLLYSLRDMDEENMTRFFSQCFGTKIGLRWVAINTGKRKGKWDPNAEIARAIHVECEASKAGEVMTGLSMIYSSTATEFPFYQKMRFLPVPKQVMNTSSKVKLERLANRQLQFCNKIAYARTWEIVGLYHTLPEAGGRNLAELITSIPSRTLPHLSLFHMVSPGWTDGHTTLAFVPQLEEEARTMVAALLPYLAHHHGDSIYKCFTTQAQDRAVQCTWDEETGQVVSPQDQAVDEAADMDEEFHFETDVQVEMPSTGPAPTGGTAAFTQENDSVSTFRDTGAKAKAKKKDSILKSKTGKGNPSRATPSGGDQVPTDNTSHDESMASALTMETIESRIEECVESVLSGRLTELIASSMEASMETYMQKLALSAKSNDTDPSQSGSASGAQAQQSAPKDGMSGGPNGIAAKR